MSLSMPHAKHPLGLLLPLICVCITIGCGYPNTTENAQPSNPAKKIEPVEPLLLFTGVIQNPQTLAKWSSVDRVNRLKALFQRVPQLVAENRTELIPILIAAQTAPERAIHLPAFYILHHLTRQDLTFVPFGTTQERREAQGAWNQWWRAVKPQFQFPELKFEQSTLIVDEIPGRIVGNDEEPPGRLLHLSATGDPLVNIDTLKMPYDAVRTEDGNYLVNIIRARGVWKVSPSGQVLWKKNVGGYPCSLQLLDRGHFLVAGWDDGIPGFVREYSPSGELVWRIEDLRWPWKAERLANGHTLIADAGTNRVFEVTAAGEEVWAVDQLGPERPELFDALGPVYCQRLPDGHTLVSIRGLSRIVELDSAGKVVWQVEGALISTQYAAVRLWNGNTLIADQGHFRVIEIDIDKNVVWQKKDLGYPAKAYRY